MEAMVTMRGRQVMPPGVFGRASDQKSSGEVAEDVGAELEFASRLCLPTIGRSHNAGRYCMRMSEGRWCWASSSSQSRATE